MTDTHGTQDLSLLLEFDPIEQLQRWLLDCNSLEDLLTIHDKATAIKELAKNARRGLELHNQAAELALGAERKIGCALLHLRLHGGNRKGVSSAHCGHLKLDALGIDRHESSRWQSIASIPDEVFESYLQITKTSGQLITCSGTLDRSLFELVHSQRRVQGHDRLVHSFIAEG